MCGFFFSFFLSFFLSSSSSSSLSVFVFVFVVVVVFRFFFFLGLINEVVSNRNPRLGWRGGWCDGAGKG